MMTLNSPASGTHGAGTASSRLSGLEGLRAFAVVAVVAFHFDPADLPGGFLGVDVFFVLSGFLITHLLLAQISSLGTLRIGTFYQRRVARLLPAVLVLIAAVMAGSVLIWRDALATSIASAASSLAYVTNWWLIGGHLSYFASTGRPPMLQHLWSLAIEEQFYLVWPPIVLLIAWVVKRRSSGLSAAQRAKHVARGLAVLAATAVVGSTAAMALIAAHTGVPYRADSSRVYFGTDTHATGLALGALLAAMLASGWTLPRVSPRTRRILCSPAAADLASLTSLIGLAWLMLGVDEFTPWLYRFGFLLVAALAGVAVVAVSRPGSQIGRILNSSMIRWIGVRSYAIYLWHWPVTVVTRPDLDLSAPAWVITGIRIAATLLLAAATYRWVEQPMRGRFTESEASPVRSRSLKPARALGLAVAACTVFVIGCGILLPTSKQDPAAASASVPIATLVLPHTATIATDARPRWHPTPRATPRPAQLTTPSLSGFGDSVLLGAEQDLHALNPHSDFDAVEGRQAYDVLGDIAARQRRHSLGSIVLIHVGDNGVIDPAQLTSVLSMLRDRTRVIVFTLHVPRDWQDPNNNTITTVARHFTNVAVVDWHDLAARNPQWLYGDGIHLNPTGRAAYASLVQDAY